MLTRGLIGVIVGTIVVIGGTAIFLTATDAGLFEARSIDDPTTIVRINSRAIPVELADSTDEHAQGLSERQELSKGTGMLFVFEEKKPVSFWMRRMRFPLDIIWISDGRIVGIERNIPPPLPGTAEENLPLYQSSEPISHALEINAGEAEGLSIGDGVEIVTLKTL